MSPYCGTSSDAALGNFGSSSIRAGSFARLTSLPCCELGRLSRCLLKGRPLTVLVAGAGVAASGLAHWRRVGFLSEAVELPGRMSEAWPQGKRSYSGHWPMLFPPGVASAAALAILSLSSMSCAVNTCGSTPTTHSAAGILFTSSDSMHSSRAVSMRLTVRPTIPVGSTSGRAECVQAPRLLGVFSSTELSIGHCGHHSPQQCCVRLCGCHSQCFDQVGRLASQFGSRSS